MHAFASYITRRSRTSVTTFARDLQGSASQRRDFDLLHYGATSCLDAKHL